MSNKRYNFQENDIKPFHTKLLYITSAVFGSDWHSTLHSHHFTELFYVLGGNGSFIVEDITLPVKIGDMIMINPYTTHTEVSLAANPLEYIALGVEGIIFMDNQSMDINGYQKHNFNSYKNDILFYLKALLNEVTEENLNYDIVCRNLLDILIINIVRKTNYAFSVGSNKKMNKQCASIKRYIDMNYTENITLDSLAEMTHMNKYYMVHAFQKYMGISPISYLINIRIDESKNLLKNTNHSLLEISNIIGFSSQSYFSQSFRKNTGMSPNNYRKEQNAVSKKPNFEMEKGDLNESKLTTQYCIDYD